MFARDGGSCGGFGHFQAEHDAPLLSLTRIHFCRLTIQKKVQIFPVRAAETLPGPQLFGHFLPQKLGQTARLELGRIPQAQRFRPAGKFLIVGTGQRGESGEIGSAPLLDGLALLGKPFIFLCFLGIMCHVGIDVGTNTTAPKILMERLGMTLADAGFATSLYFIFRTAGCFLGAFILQKMAPRTFFGISVLCMLAAMVGLFVFHEKTMIYICIALIGFGNSNIFPVIFSQALLAMPQKKNEVSGLMIMGLFGGTVFPIAMGLASDAVGQSGAVAVMTVGVVYLFFYMLRMKR